MKVLLILGFIAATATIVKTSNANWGKRVNEDKLILNETIIAYPEVGKHQKRYVKYSTFWFGKVVSAIYVKDNFRNASGAQGSLLNGGMGKRFAIIRLYSQQSQGINSTVLIYGK